MQYTILIIRNPQNSLVIIEAPMVQQSKESEEVSPRRARRTSPQQSDCTCTGFWRFGLQGCTARGHLVRACTIWSLGFSNEVSKLGLYQPCLKVKGFRIQELRYHHDDCPHYLGVSCNFTWGILVQVLRPKRRVRAWVTTPNT